VHSSRRSKAWRRQTFQQENTKGEKEMRMKLRQPTVQRQIIAVVFEGEKWEYVVATWPEGQPLPAQVVSMIMDTWTPDGSWVHKDGSILYVQARRQRGRAVRVERYPLIVVDEANEVLYGVEALEAAKQQGVDQVRAHIISDADGFPPRGQRRPMTN
jgi:hypothetical protein